MEGKNERRAFGQKKCDFRVDTEFGEFSYRAVALIIQNNKLLVAKHIDYDFYYTVGGRVMLNETSEEAAIREAFEETGYKFEIDRLLFVQERFTKNNNSGKNHHEIVFFYLMKPNDNVKIENGSFTDQPNKEALHWIEINKLPKINIVPEFIKTHLQNIEDNIQHIITIESIK